MLPTLGHMYLRESKQRRADGSTVSYLLLAENVWAPERRRSETHVVYNCGRADDPAVVERLRKLAASILRRCSPEEIVGAGGGDLRLLCAWAYGEVYVGAAGALARRRDPSALAFHRRRSRRCAEVSELARKHRRFRPDAAWPARQPHPARRWALGAARASHSCQ